MGKRKNNANTSTNPAQLTAALTATIAPKRTIQPNRAVGNGVTAPSVGGKCSAVWVAVAAMQAANGGVVPAIAQVRAWGVQQGLNANNVQIEYYNYRKHIGVRGRVKVATPTAITPTATTA